MTARIVECYDLPELPEPGCAYRLLPRGFNEREYRERTNRHIGWITAAEQEFLRHCTLGDAGCGGMGGPSAITALRAGIQRIKIADPEVYDLSNVNRQPAAGRNTVGVSKAFATARYMRQHITDDSEIWVFPQGITEDTAEMFVEGCDVICDEIEFQALTGRYLLHRAARATGVSVFNCNSVGYGTRLWLFTPDGLTMEQMVGLSFEEADFLERRIRAGNASRAERNRFMQSLVDGLVPELPRYTSADSPYQDLEAVLERLFDHGEASISPTNPGMAAGFLGDHVLFYLLRDSEVRRCIIRPPEPPAYLYFDVGFGIAKTGGRGY